MMISITIIWIICISICDGNVPSKLYGGTRVEIGEHPYVVSLQWKGVHQCGGSIISLDTIITSASCVVIDTVPLIYQSNLQVLIGTNNNLAHHGNGLLYSIRYLIAHQNYDPHDAWINDLALLKLVTPITPFINKHKISIPTTFLRFTKNLQTIGWGGSNFLNKIIIQMESMSYCHEFSSNLLFYINVQSCASAVMKNSGVSLGDSGNPIIFGQYIVGIISVSVPINSGNLIFTKIYSYKDWIQRFISSK